MDYIKMKLRRIRRRNRIPHGLLVSVSAMMAVFVLTAMLGTFLFALPASAKVDFRMPRTDDGIVTDGDGIIDSDGIADSIPDMTDIIPDGDGSAEGESILPDVSESGTESREISEQVTTERVTEPVTTQSVTTNMVDDVTDGNPVNLWVIGLVILAVVAIVIILIVRWASGSRGRE